MKHVVKRKGHKEDFDDRKVYASVYAAALNSHYDEVSAENVAALIADHMEDWLHDRAEVKSSEIRKEIINTLNDIDEDVALMYDSILDVC